MLERRVNQYCQEGRIPGLLRFGRSWCILANTQKPTGPKKINRQEGESLCSK
ncbi:DNA-binding protein [Sporanaerobium hydrogeniformans]|uniref:DNA-binding protein n=1 Tax=Sporanaerobium hydrogeniformans TaxID=3072179 RepID=A0AC61DCJ8_9FIRM|nr:DNA-binding protein [Sporanaerobium hydrogeniformans]